MWEIVLRRAGMLPCVGRRSSLNSTLFVSFKQRRTWIEGHDKDAIKMTSTNHPHFLELNPWISPKVKCPLSIKPIDTV